LHTAASIGIDVGGTKTRIALFGREFKVIADIKFKTPDTKKDFTTALDQSVDRLEKRAKALGQGISRIGVGVAGTVNGISGRITSSPNLPFIEGFSFKEALAGICRCPVVVMNDVQAALYGELRVGRARGCKNVIAIYIGTGISGALAINGELHFGQSGQAGNIGHYLLHAFGPLAGSERHGILDDFASRIAIAGTAATFAAKNWAPHLLKIAGTDVRNIRSSAFADSIRKGDTMIEELVRSRVRIVGIVLSNMVDFLSPQMIVLGGGLTDALPRLVREEVDAGIRAHSSEAALRGLRVVTSKHKGHGVTVGAAKFALDSKTR
jgi:glucokinase